MNAPQLVARWWQGIVAPGWVRPHPTARQRRIDVLFSVAFLGASALSALLIASMGGLPGAAPPMGWQGEIGWILALGLPLVWRRRFPITVSLVVSAVFIASQQAGFLDNLMASVSLFWALYSVGAWSRNRLPAFWVRCLIVAAMFASIGFNVVRNRDEIFSSVNEYPATGPLDPFVAGIIYNLLFNVVYFAASTYFGTVAWTSAKRSHLLADQAAALAAAQDASAQRAVMRERVHIARELHDVVAHHVSVMGVQASAARRVLGKSPELASDALTAVETTARVAITELRGLLGVLRDAASDDGHPTSADGENFHPTPGVDQIPELIEHGRSAGLVVQYGVFGEQRSLPGGLSLSLFRIVQEALTNVLKHASATRVDIRLRYLDTTVEVEITDDGVGASARRPAPSEGLGLVGMRERITVHGGSLEVGPRRPGGFRVRATLPYRSFGEAAVPGGTAGIGALDG